MMNSVVYALALLCCGAGLALAGEGPYAVFSWTKAHATFYGGDDARGTQGTTLLSIVPAHAIANAGLGSSMPSFHRAISIKSST